MAQGTRRVSLRGCAELLLSGMRIALRLLNTVHPLSLVPEGFPLMAPCLKPKAMPISAWVFPA
ncbi:MAG: hypothetical protein ABI604_13745 [Nitrospirota bacterium]